MARVPEIEWSRLRLGELLGQGAFGEVFEADVAPFGRCAVKVPRPGQTLGVLDDFRAEASRMASATHENVLTVLATALEPQSGGRFAIIMPRMEMSLKKAIQLRDDSGSAPLLDGSAREALAYQAAHGLRALHAAGVLHRDIKSDNALVNLNKGAGLRLCWTDFGVSKVAASTTLHTMQTMTQVGTLGYMAPEISDLEGATHVEYNRPVDVYAFGVVLGELVSGKPPCFPGRRGLDLLPYWMRDNGFDPERCVDQAAFRTRQNVARVLLDLVDRCTHEDGSQRPDMASVMSTLLDIPQDGANGPRPGTPAQQSAASADPDPIPEPTPSPAPAPAPGPDVGRGTAPRESEPRLCKVCMDATINTLLLPCRHACVCEECATRIRERGKCPICRERLTGCTVVDPSAPEMQRTFVQRQGAPNRANVAEPQEAQRPRSIAVGSQVRMTESSSAACWAGCPGQRLSFSNGSVFHVVEVVHPFFRVREFLNLWAPVGSAVLVQDAAPRGGTRSVAWSVGDMVRIRPVAQDEARRLAAGHGNWSARMGPLLGTTGPVQVVYRDRVKVNNYLWNPAMLERWEARGPVNLAGVPMQQGEARGRHYCGRALGSANIPGSDGQCGPSNGPSCPDCTGAQRRKCLQGHILALPPAPAAATSAYRCDVCRSTGRRGSGEFRCDPCDFDACNSCAERMVGTRRHRGEWRGHERRIWCSLALQQDGALCSHQGGVVQAPHWSCCGACSERDTCTAAPSGASTPQANLSAAEASALARVGGGRTGTSVVFIELRDRSLGAVDIELVDYVRKLVRRTLGNALGTWPAAGWPGCSNEFDNAFVMGFTHATQTIVAARNLASKQSAQDLAQRLNVCLEAFNLRAKAVELAGETRSAVNAASLADAVEAAGGDGGDGHLVVLAPDSSAQGRATGAEVRNLLRIHVQNALGNELVQWPAAGWRDGDEFRQAFERAFGSASQLILVARKLAAPAAVNLVKEIQYKVLPHGFTVQIFQAREERPFQIGDLVLIRDVTPSIAEQLQRLHGGWNAETMGDKLGQTGFISGKAGSAFLVLGAAWSETLIQHTYKPVAGPRIISVGDRVRVRAVSLAVGKSLQQGHGGWASSMDDMLGKTGVVTKMDRDGDLRVFGKVWNPALLEAVTGAIDAD